MRLLRDENVTRKLAPLLKGHEVLTVQRMGWDGWTNGQLLSAMRVNRFDYLITMDRNMQHQLPLEKYRIRLMVLVARRNDIESLRPLVPEVLDCLAHDSDQLVTTIGLPR